MKKQFSLAAALKRLVNRVQIRWYIFFHRSRKTPFTLYESHAVKKPPMGVPFRLAAFFTAFTLLTLLAFAVPLRPTYSEQERRELAKFPQISLESLADGSYFEALSLWYADTFPFREHFLSLQNGVERLYGLQTQRITGEVQQGDAIPIVADEEDEEETPLVLPAEPAPPEAPAEAEPAAPSAPAEPIEPEEPAGPEESELPEDPAPADPPEAEEQPPVEEPPVEEEELVIPDLDEDAVVEKLSAVLSIDNAAYEYYNFVQSTADRYTGLINRAASQLEGISRVYSVIVPNSMGICVPEDVQASANTSNQKDAIKYMNSCFEEGVTPIPIYNTLLKHYLDGEYLYFRTDHHWTAQGAYYAYAAFAAAAGKTPAALEDYIVHEYPGFLGTFYNSTKSAAMKKTPDTVFAYEPPSTNTIHIKTKNMDDWRYLIIGNVEGASAGNKYATFIGGDNPFSFIENPNLDDGSSVMLIKESYGNAFAPFLVESYQHVYVVDYRYISQVDDRKLAALCKDLEIDDVLFLNTISTTRSSKLVEKLDTFVG